MRRRIPLVPYFIFLFFQLLLFPNNARKYGSILKAFLPQPAYSFLYRNVSLLKHIFVLVELQPVITSRPPNPSTVGEGQNLTLQWSYNLGGQPNDLTGMFNVTRGALGTRIATRFQNNNTIVSARYENQFAASISDTQAILTILYVPRSVNQEIYRLWIFTTTYSTQSDVEISVLCKYCTINK